jgi:hypothetical protein
MSYSMMSSISVCLNSAQDEEGNTIFIFKFQGQDWELNIWMTKPELALIAEAQAAHWNQHGSVRIGKSAGIPAFWSCEDGKLSILIDQDDECWDFGVTMPEAVIDDMVTEIERETLRLNMCQNGGANA